jgi:hypothetical protein
MEWIIVVCFVVVFGAMLVYALRYGAGKRS